MPEENVSEFVDQQGKRFTLDTALEVVIGGKVGYIEENAHTHRGRMHIYFPHLGRDRTCSLYQIDSMSAAARWWIKGFLAGSEPSIEEYLGIVDVPEGATPDWTWADYERWKQFNARCREAGSWPTLNSRPYTPLVITDAERAELRIEGEMKPWAYAGERVWVPHGETWVEAEPQPEIVDGELAGTICAKRGHPDLMGLDSGWTICLDCGEVTAP